MAAPLGNSNAAKAKIWSAAINRALDARTRLEGKEALDDLAEKLLTLCGQGDLGALKELGDRLEGKAHQSVAFADENGNPVVTRIELVGVKPKEQ